MSAHAPFAPSSASRWLTCTGSFGLGLQMPEAPESPYAADGTRLHDIAAAYLTCSDPIMVEPEDYKLLRPYLDYATRLIDMVSGKGVADVECRMEYNSLLFGTSDLVVRDADWLEVVDLKTGAGILVDPERNDQLFCYAFLALSRVPPAAFQRIKRVKLTIVQPPDEDRPIKSWETTTTEVMAWGARALSAIQAAIEGSTDLVPGEHCRFCKAKPVCPKLMGYVTEAMPLVVRELRPEKLAVWLDKADLMQQWLDALREIGHDVASRGIEIPGYELKPKRATRSWADEDAVLEIARRRKIKIWQDKLMSPAMAEKAHPKLPEELTSLIVAVSSGSNLVKSKGPKPQAPTVAVESDADPKTAKLMANFALLKHRR
jgi:hypothetical protein